MMPKHLFPSGQRHQCPHKAGQTLSPSCRFGVADTLPTQGLPLLSLQAPTSENAFSAFWGALPYLETMNQRPKRLLMSGTGLVADNLTQEQGCCPTPQILKDDIVGPMLFGSGAWTQTPHFRCTVRPDTNAQRTSSTQLSGMHGAHRAAHIRHTHGTNTGKHATPAHTPHPRSSREEGRRPGMCCPGESGSPGRVAGQAYPCPRFAPAAQLLRAGPVRLSRARAPLPARPRPRHQLPWGSQRELARIPRAPRAPPWPLGPP